MSILCIGQSAYDITLPVKGPIRDNQKYRIYESYYSGGGPAFNAACLCALWGADVSLLSRVGHDTYGQILEKILESYGVNRQLLIQTSQVQTPYSYIFVDQSTGNRTIFNHPSLLFDVEVKALNKPPKVILTDGHEQQLSLEMIKRYPQALSVIDAGTCRESTLEVARFVDYLVCSEDFARQYTGESLHLEDWHKCQMIFDAVKAINQKQAVITLGERGLLYEQEGKLCHLPAYKVKVIDTTGAGDIFHGAFAYGLDQDLSLKDNLKQSAMAAALSLETVGSQKSIRPLGQVKDAIANEAK